jgi:hypothetical protein
MNADVLDSDDLMNWLLLNPDVIDVEGGQFLSNRSLDAFETTPHFKATLPDDEMKSNLNKRTYAATQKQKVDGVKEVKKTKHLASTDSLVSLEGKKSEKTATKTIKKKPRETVEDIERRVQELKAENADLQSHLLTVNQRTNEVYKQRTTMEKLMALKVAELGDNPNSDQSELSQIVKKYTDIYADYGKCRQREVFLLTFLIFFLIFFFLQ